MVSLFYKIQIPNSVIRRTNPPEKRIFTRYQSNDYKTANNEGYQYYEWRQSMCMTSLMDALFYTLLTLSLKKTIVNVVEEFDLKRESCVTKASHVRTILTFFCLKTHANNLRGQSYKIEDNPMNTSRLLKFYKNILKLFSVKPNLTATSKEQLPVFSIHHFMVPFWTLIISMTSEQRPSVNNGHYC